MRAVRLLIGALLLVCVELTGNVQVSGAKPPIELRGSVTYLEKMFLPRTAQIRLQLVDQDEKESNPAFVQMIPTEGKQVPISFTLSVPSNKIRQDRIYVLHADILIGGKVWFSGRQKSAVLMHGHPSVVRILLERVS
jgi:putative lipoprotein